MTPFARQRWHTTVRSRDRRLHKECEARLAAIGVPASWAVDDLADLVAGLRERPIHRIPVAMGATHPCGFWIATETADFIVYESNTSRVHQEHIIVHELSHIICCHRGSSALDDVTARLMFPDLDPDLVRDMLRRTGYSDHQEREAEMLASVIMARISQRQPGMPAVPAIAQDIQRIERSLTY